jgi:hypothetical protein
VEYDPEWQLSNDSLAQALHTTAGDTYKATPAVVGKADLVADRGRPRRAVKLTIDAGDRRVLLSRADQAWPPSPSRRRDRPGTPGADRPGRHLAPWLPPAGRDVLARTGATDGWREQGPAAGAEAPVARQLDQRRPPRHRRLAPLAAARDGPRGAHPDKGRMQQAVAALWEGLFDLAVVGGGITGAGVAPGRGTARAPRRPDRQGRPRLGHVEHRTSLPLVPVKELT